jgi:hypothetical protein
MRLRIASLGRTCKADLPAEFVRQDLTSYGGLELLRRFFSRIGLYPRLRRAFDAAGMGGDYGGGRLVLLIVGLLAVGARCLHLRYVASDPLLARLSGLARIPSSRTVVNWLGEQLSARPLHSRRRALRVLGRDYQQNPYAQKTLELPRRPGKTREDLRRIEPPPENRPPPT